MVIRKFGDIPAGEAHLYLLENSAGTRLTLTDAGASVTALLYRGVDVVLGWPDAGGYAENPGSFGATVGRSANRIAGARFFWDGREYVLAKNIGEDNLHSGPNGYQRRLWETAEAADNSVTFLMDSPDGDQGFPGHLRLFVTYTLTEDDEVHILYRAETDRDTPINVTNHAYFNLNGHGAGDIHGHALRLWADAYTPVRPEVIPTGEVAAVEGTPFDFRSSHPIGRDIAADHPQLRRAGGYDHNFCLNGSGLRPAAELTGDRTGITLTVFTDRPGIQLYTGNSLHGERGKDGAVYRRRDAVCLETQNWPNAVNEPDFPSPRLRAGEEFRSETVWRFSCAHA